MNRAGRSARLNRDLKGVNRRMKWRIRSVLCLALAWLMTVSVCLAEETPDLKDDFFEAVNAEWLAQAEIPADSRCV